MNSKLFVLYYDEKYITPEELQLLANGIESILTPNNQKCIFLPKHLSFESIDKKSLILRLEDMINYVKGLDDNE